MKIILLMNINPINTKNNKQKNKYKKVEMKNKIS